MPLGNPITIENESRIISVTTTTTNDTFIVEDGYKINQINVYRNGVRLVSGSDFLANDASTVQLINSPNIGDVIEFHIFDDFLVNDAIVGAASSQVIYGDLTINGTLYTNNDLVVNISEYADRAGIATYATTAGITTYAPTSGIATYASTAGIATYASTAGIATLASGLTGTPDITVRNIVAVAATFSGDVSVGGTVTFEDTSGVNVVGVVTAQGLDITGESVSNIKNTVIENYSEPVVAIGNVGANRTFSLGSGNYFTATLDQNSIFVFDYGTAPTGSVSFILQLKNGTGGPFSITWPASIEWPAGVTPTRTTTDGRTDVWTFITTDGGTNWLGNLAINNYNI